MRKREMGKTAFRVAERITKLKSSFYQYGDNGLWDGLGDIFFSGPTATHVLSTCNIKY